MVFPDLPEKYVAGYLSGLIFDNEHAFFYQDHAVALAQMVHSPGIKTVKVVQERFVWVEDIKNKDQLENAAGFYAHIKFFLAGSCPTILIRMRGLASKRFLMSIRRIR